MPVRASVRSANRTIGTQNLRCFWQDRDGNGEQNREKEVRNPMVQTLQKNIRVTAEQWHRIEDAAREREVSPNQLVIELALEALDRRRWPSTEAEIHLLRSAMFAAQAIALDMEKAGRQDEIEQISRIISEVAPELA